MTIRSTQTRHRLGLAAIAAGCCLLLFVAYALPDLLMESVWVRQRFNVERIPFLWAYKRAESGTQDALQVYGKKAVLAPDVIFLAIDSPTIEQSELSEQERLTPALQMMATGFPFPRAVYPLILERLAAAGAKVVIFDLLFTSPKEGDDEFRLALEKHRDSVVIGSNFQDLMAINSGGRNILVTPSPSLIPSQDPKDPRVGFVNFKPDSDLVVRHAQYRTTPLEYFNEAPAGIDDPAQELLSLAALGASKAGYGSLIPPGREPVLFRFLRNPRDLSLHDIFVPSLWEKNFANGEVFRNKIVFIGPYGNWSKDELITPFGSMLGPKIHLSALNALLTQDFLHYSSPWMDVTLMMLGGVIAVLIGFSVGHPLVRTAVLLALSALFVVIAFLLFNYHGLVLNLLGPNLALLASGFIGLGWERVIEGQEKARVRQMLEGYVSKDVVSEVLDNPQSFLNTEGGMRKPITILFSDIRGFSSLTETADPATLVKQLNEYFTEMVRIVFANRGTMDKFIGDAVMAHWGSIVTRGTGPDASRAVAAALQMQQVLPRLNADWKARGLLEFQIGIGLNHGDAICAHIGSDEMHEVTAIGDAVNLASRLESATKEFHQKILIGQQLADLVRDNYLLRSVTVLQVMGRTQPVEVFAVVGDRETMAVPAWLAAHEEGIRQFRARAFAEAIAKFSEVLTENPADWLAQEYVRRCREFIENPPPENWDASYLMTRK